MKERLHEQEGFCGPTVLQWVAKEEGIIKTQTELAELMGTTNKDGTPPDKMVECAKKIGLTAYPAKGADIESLGELLDNHHIIVDWMSGPNENDDGHYSELEKVDKGMVYLKDATMTVEEFDKRFYDIDDGKRSDRWAMIIWKR